mgnify:FL=1
MTKKIMLLEKDDSEAELLTSLICSAVPSEVRVEKSLKAAENAVFTGQFDAAILDLSGEDQHGIHFL